MKKKILILGVPVELDVYRTDVHAFDMMRPDDAMSIQAAERFNDRFAHAGAVFRAPAGGCRRRPRPVTLP